MFASSSKTQRSPSKNETGTMDTLVDRMEQMFQMQETFMEEMKEIKVEIKNLRLERENENRKLREEVEQLKNQIENIEKRERKNNLKIEGMNWNNNEEKKKQVENFLENKLDLTIKVKEAFEIGKNKKRMLVKLFEREEKVKIMKNKSKLAGGNRNGPGIYINDDLTQKEMKTQIMIRKEAITLRRLGKMVKIGYGKLIINGEVWLPKEEDFLRIMNQMEQ